MVRAFQKGDQTQTPSSEVARVASSIKMKDAKKFASTKHKGLPEKKVKKESVEHGNQTGNSDFKSSAEFMNTFAKMKALRKKNDKIGTGNTGLPQGVVQKSRRGTKQGVEESSSGGGMGAAVTGSTSNSYTGPSKADRKVIKKMDNKKFASKLKDYEKNMDPEKRQALKDKATKGMKFTHEGTSYGLFKGSGKPSGAMAAFAKKKDSGSGVGYEPGKPAAKLGAVKLISKKDADSARERILAKTKAKREAAKKADQKEETEVYWSSKALDQLDELQKKEIEEAKYEAGASDYGKTSIRNKRAFGKGGNAADPKERGGAKMLRHDAHAKRRYVKKNNKYGATNKPPVDGAPSDEFKKNRYVRKEEGYDVARDEGRVPPTKKKNVNTPGQGTTWKRPGNALDMVKKSAVQKYGKGAIMGEELSPKMKAIDAKSKANFAAQAKKGADDRKAKAASAAKFQAQKKSEMSKGKRPDQALDSWQKKKMKKEDTMLSFSDFLKEGNDRARMMSKAKNQTTGNIAADRGTDEKKNRASRKGLEKDLKKKGIGFKKSVGKYKYDDGSQGKEVSYQTSPGKGMSKRKFGKLTRRLGRKHGQESVITKKAGKPARLHDTESKKPGKSYNLGKEVKKGKNPSGEGETSATKVRGGKLPKKTKPNSTYHYGKKK